MCLSDVCTSQITVGQTPRRISHTPHALRYMKVHAEGAGSLQTCVGDVTVVAVEVISSLPEPILLSDVQLRLILVQESAGTHQTIYVYQIIRV